MRPGLVRKARPHRPAIAGEEVTRVLEARLIRHSSGARRASPRRKILTELAAVFAASGAALGGPPGSLEDEPPVPSLDPPNELGPSVCQEPFHITARVPAQAVLDRREFRDRVELRLKVIISRTSLVCHERNLPPEGLQARHRVADMRALLDSIEVQPKRFHRLH